MMELAHVVASPANPDEAAGFFATDGTRRGRDLVVEYTSQLHSQQIAGRLPADHRRAQCCVLEQSCVACGPRPTTPDVRVSRGRVRTDVGATEQLE